MRLAIFLVICASAVYAADEWNYGQQGSDWTGTCKSGEKQSPISLSKFQSIRRDISLQFYEFEQLLVNPEIMNNGHSLQLNLNSAARFKSSNSDSIFKLNSLHFHWGNGSAKQRGSEHRVNGKYYPAELHIVSVNEKYEAIEDAVTDPNGLAVLGILLKVAKDTEVQNDNGLNKIFEKVSQVTVYNTSASLDGTTSVDNLIKGLKRDEFFSYEGSLTTPECDEAVNWFVFTNPLSVKESQLESLFKMKDSHGQQLINNYRELQKRKGRKIYYTRSINLPLPNFPRLPIRIPEITF